MDLLEQVDLPEHPVQAVLLEHLVHPDHLEHPVQAVLLELLAHRDLRGPVDLLENPALLDLVELRELLDLAELLELLELIMEQYQPL